MFFWILCEASRSQIPRTEPFSSAVGSFSQNKHPLTPCEDAKTIAEETWEDYVAWKRKQAPVTTHSGSCGRRQKQLSKVEEKSKANLGSNIGMVSDDRFWKVISSDLTPALRPRDVERPSPH